MCRSSGGNASARAVEAEPAEPQEEREIQHVWALSVCDISGIPLDVLSVCDNSDLPSDESGNLLNMIMDSGAEEHVVSLADWKSLGEPLLKLAQVRLRSATGVNSTPHTSHFLVVLHLMTRTRVAQVVSLSCAHHIP